MKEKLRVVGRYSRQHRQEINNDTKSCSQRNILWSAWTYTLARTTWTSQCPCILMIQIRYEHYAQKTKMSSGTWNIFIFQRKLWKNDRLIVSELPNLNNWGLVLSYTSGKEIGCQSARYACGHYEGSVKSMRIPAPITIWKWSSNLSMFTSCLQTDRLKILWRSFTEKLVKYTSTILFDLR